MSDTNFPPLEPTVYLVAVDGIEPEWIGHECMTTTSERGAVITAKELVKHTGKRCNIYKLVQTHTYSR